MTAERTPAETVALHGRDFVLGHWYEYGLDQRPAQFLGLIHSRVDSVKYRHIARGPLRVLICSVDEWVDRAGDEIAAPKAS